VTDFSWEPKGERFAIVSSSDPNLGNPGPGITVKTDVSFYQLDRVKNDFKPLRTAGMNFFSQESILLTSVNEIQEHLHRGRRTLSDGPHVGAMSFSRRSDPCQSLSWISGTWTSTQMILEGVKARRSLIGVAAFSS
jgi:hypothetical protein